MKQINNHYKLLVIDIDGTLVGVDSNISDDNRNILARVRDAGVQVSLSTGRSVQSCRDILCQLSLDGYHIFCDGALVSNPDVGEEVYAQPLSKEVIKQAIEYADSHEIDIEFYSTTRYLANRESWSTEAHRQFFRVAPVIVDFSNIWGWEKIIKGGIVATNPQEAAKARGFCTKFDSCLNFSWVRTPAYPDVEFINIIAPGVSKGKALATLASYLKIHLSEVMAVGDGNNDVSVLSSAGLAVAMGNAPDEVKAVAHHVTLDVANNGLAAAIDRFLL